MVHKEHLHIWLTPVLQIKFAVLKNELFSNDLYYFYTNKILILLKKIHVFSLLVKTMVNQTIIVDKIVKMINK